MTVKRLVKVQITISSKPLLDKENYLKKPVIFQNPFVKKTENEKKPIESLKRA